MYYYDIHFIIIHFKTDATDYYALLYVAFLSWS
jgi:hypothetical protein